jgi:hypothetical protein
MVCAPIVRRCSCLFLLVGLVFVAPPSVFPQDSHYWTNQFGNRARLLGGAVVGSTRDVSAVYYNPGALALVDQPELLLAGNVIELTRIRISGTTPDGNDAGSTTLRLSPSLFAGEVRTKSTTNRFAYSFLTKQSARLDVKTRQAGSGADVGLPDVDFASNGAAFQQDLSEYWVGATWSRKVHSNVGLGVTQFVAVRNHSASFEDFAQALGQDKDNGALSILTRGFDYRQWRLLWKIGLATQIQNWELGVTVTTPGVGLGGNGESAIDRSALSTLPGEGPSSPVIASDSQNVAADFHSPFSIAIGGAHRFGRTRLHVSAEWFASVPNYTILDTQPFAAQSSGEIVDTDVTQALHDVLNVAVGLEQRFSDNVVAYGAFHTDYAGVEPAARANASAVPLNLYHFSGGAILTAGKTSVTVGGVAAIGHLPLENVGAVREFEAGGELHYLRLSLLVGFNFEFR